MSYDKLLKNGYLKLTLPYKQDVTGSSPVLPIVLSYAEFGIYEYLSCGSAVVTLIRKAVVLLFLKGAKP